MGWNRHVIPATILARRASAQHGVFTTADALAAGLTKRQIDRFVARGAYVPIYKGVYGHAPAPHTLEMYQVAACFWAGDGSALSHRSALAEFALADVLSDVIEVTTPARRCHDAEIIVHRTNYLPAHHVVRRRGRPFTDVARTLFDAGYVVSRRVLSRAIDQAIQRRLTTTKELWGRLAEHGGRGRRGCGYLRKALEERDPLNDKTQSTLESLMVRVVWSGALPRPVAQYSIRFAGGRRRVDFAYPDVKLGIEADGWRDHGVFEAFDADRHKDADVAALGWLILRFTWRQLREEPDWVVESIEQVYNQRLALSLVAGRP